MMIQVTRIRKTGKTYEVTIQADNLERVISNIAVYSGLSVGQQLKLNEKILMMPPDGEELQVEQHLRTEN